MLLLAAAGSTDPSWGIALVLFAAGALAMLGGLGWLAWRTIRGRRHLPAERYRGPSVLLLFVLAVATANILSFVPLVAAAVGGGDVTDPGPVTVTALLLITPAVFALVSGLFVLRPRALEGVRLTDGPRTAVNLARGIALGAGAWVLAALVAAGLSWVVTQLTGQEPVDDQIVAGLATSLPPVVAIALIGVLSPMAEELFFRGVALNAWARERSTSVAVIGSALLFGAAHLFGGTLLALPPIFLLGLILAVAYVTTRSLPLVIGVHATFNCLSLAVLFLSAM